MLVLQAELILRAGMILRRRLAEPFRRRYGIRHPHPALIANQAEIVLVAGMALIGGFLEPRNRRIEILLDSFAGDVERAEGKLRGRGAGLAAF
jgi:hypothetical protein